MRIVNEACLDRFRQAFKCEWCGAFSRGRMDPHHVLGRGTAGAWRLDIPEALISLCPAFVGGSCHTKYGDLPAYQPKFLAVIAKREGFASAEVLKDWLLKIRELPKNSELPERP